MRKKIGLFMLGCVTSLQLLMAANQLPVPDKPSSWVNDYAGVFSAEEKSNLDQKLNMFQYNSSTQIFLVTIDNNEGYAASDLAPRIGELWGVGQKGKDNGIVILMDMMDRQVFIATGYGLEAYVPDAIAGRIVRNEILPQFKTGNFYAGINDGIDVITSLLEGKFTPDEYRQQTGGSTGPGILGVIIAIIIFMAVFGGGRRRSMGMGRSNLPLWIALGMLGSASRRSGSFGNFSSGSGSFGGGFGGFTGGGGGSFGGGGAGGGW